MCRYDTYSISLSNIGSIGIYMFVISKSFFHVIYYCFFILVQVAISKRVKFNNWCWMIANWKLKPITPLTTCPRGLGRRRISGKSLKYKLSYVYLIYLIYAYVSAICKYAWLLHVITRSNNVTYSASTT